MKRTSWIVPLVIIAALVIGIIVMRNQPKVVEVIQAQRRDVSRTLAVTGQVEAISNTNLSSTINGIQVLKVLVDKGSRVKSGQPLIILDDRELRAGFARAEAQAKVSEANTYKAKAQLSAALAGLERTKAQASGAGKNTDLASEALKESIDLKNQRDLASSNLKSAQERVTQAKESAARTREGARSQAIRVAQSQVRQFESQLHLSTLSLERSKSLLAQGAVSQADFDASKTSFESATETLAQAKEQLIQLSEPRTQDVSQADAFEREATANLVGAKSALENAERAYRNRTVLKQSLNNAQTDARTSKASILTSESEIKQAQAAIVAALAEMLQSRANAEQARTQLSKTILLSPVDGVVTNRKVEPGETVSNTTVLLSIATPKRLRIRADIDETNLHDIRVGQRALIAPDAYPKLRLEGTVSEIIPSANSERGTVEVRISLKDQNSPIVPQLTADVNLFTGSFPKALTLSRNAVINPDTNAKVRVVVGGKIEDRSVKVQTGDVGDVMIEEGLTENDLVVANPLSGSVGETVKTKAATREVKP